MIDKPFKPSKDERKAARELGQGNHKKWAKGEQPQHDPKNKRYHMTCTVCGYGNGNRLYVCQKCGNCQACGGLNIIGEIDQNCRYCGNGTEVAPNDVPQYTAADQHHDHHGDHHEQQLAVEQIAHNLDQISTDLNVTNLNTP